MEEGDSVNIRTGFAEQPDWSHLSTAIRSLSFSFMVSGLTMIMISVLAPNQTFISPNLGALFGLIFMVIGGQLTWFALVKLVRTHAETVAAAIRETGNTSGS